jgi:Arc/MetJ-type ribon-helix-helix transcriptional regulator
MFKIEITDNRGRKYRNLSEAVKPALDEMIDGTASQIERTLRVQQCPVHHQRPQIKRRRTGDRINFQYECCCEQLKTMTDEAFKRATR